ncbi:two-component regulator propeller domain-containing protein [Neolewinella antarctica]|uniref:DNA-binding CsgD family transcriptional regulator n=1 Tax=Neolewinella antarctica TaxID=442734 RepID=A0ABX0X7P4_9BACT|nr:two-component regulator propeller domain-containing protein [Neolewinella antarctica]NJC25070.1 DNA-binding CsgD family transcriptional regulator [Neolewinella antarctica]
MRPCLFILYLIIAQTQLAGQDSGVRTEGVPKVRYYTPEQYGGDNQNWDLAQGDDGVIYVANSAGVLSFDGAKWQRFNLPGRPVVRALAFTDGRLYAGGYGEFGYFTDLDKSDPTYTSLTDQIGTGGVREEIWKIELLLDGTIIFQSFARLYAFRSDKLIADVAPGIVLFGQSEGNRLVLPVAGQGLQYWSSDTGLNQLEGSERIGSRIVSSIARRGEGYLIATADTTFVLQHGKLKETELPSQVNRLLSLADGGLAAGTIDDGVYLTDESLRTTLHLNRDNGLGNNTVLALLEDKAGNLWVGLDRGLAVINRNGPLRYANAATAELGTVYAAARRGDLTYLGTNQGLFVRSGSEDRPFKPVAGTTGQVWELKVVDGLLLCGHNSGLFLVQGTTARLLPGGTGVWSTVVHPTDSSVFAQATYTGISILLDAANSVAPLRLPGYLAPLRSVAWVGDQRLLAAHASRGVMRIGLTGDLSDYDAIDTLGADITKPIVVRYGDTVLVQSTEQVLRYRNGGLEALKEFLGIPLPRGSLIIPGRPGSEEWFLVQRQTLSLFRGGELVTTVPVRLHADYPRIIPWGEDRYLLCLNDGYAIFDPQVGETDLPEMLLRKEVVAVNAVRFEAALPLFDRPVRYRYRLTHRQEEWSAWTDRPEFEFRDLWEGNYLFKVESDWPGTGVESIFTISPPWFRSTAAYLIYGAAFFAAIYLFYQLHRKRLTVQERRLELIRRRHLHRQEMHARNRELEDSVATKNRELANTTLSLAKKNEMLLQLRTELDRGRNEKVRHLIDRNLNNEEDWSIFESHFNDVHDTFLNKLRHAHPNLTSGDLQLAAYLKMGLASKEIAPLLHISLRGVENKRYRLRKKLELEGSDNLNQYLLDI